MPVIAAIRGSCRGGGVAIALHADLRIAADDATFSVPPANLGLSYPPEATRRLVAAVGPSQAKRLLFTAEAIDASRAERIGLVDEIVPAADHTTMSPPWSTQSPTGHHSPIEPRSASSMP